jgi:hypothetical protein
VWCFYEDHHMSKEAMKLALGVLSGSWRTEEEKNALREKQIQAVIALREALAKPDFWEGYVPEPDNTCSNALRAQGKAYPRTCKKCGLGPCVELAQQALDKMAENAREQPAQKCSYPYCGCNSKAWCKVERNEALDKKAENARELGLDYEPAQQEPEIVQRVKRYAGQTMRTARNPNITARECIELANWLAAHGIKENT